MCECVRRLAVEKHQGLRQRGLPAPPSDVGIMRPKSTQGQDAAQNPAPITVHHRARIKGRRRVNIGHRMLPSEPCPPKALPRPIPAYLPDSAHGEGANNLTAYYTTRVLAPLFIIIVFFFLFFFTAVFMVPRGVQAAQYGPRLQRRLHLEFIETRDGCAEGWEKRALGGMLCTDGACIASPSKASLTATTMIVTACGNRDVDHASAKTRRSGSRWRTTSTNSPTRSIPCRRLGKTNTKLVASFLILTFAVGMLAHRELHFSGFDVLSMVVRLQLSWMRLDLNGASDRVLNTRYCKRTSTCLLWLPCFRFRCRWGWGCNVRAVPVNSLSYMLPSRSHCDSTHSVVCAQHMKASADRTI